MKKIISVILSLAMMLALFVPAAMALTPATPIVYIEGQGTPLVNQAGEDIGPSMDEVLGVMSTNLKDMLIEYMAAWTAGSNFQIYNDKLVAMFTDLYKDVKITGFDENGRPVDGSGVPSYNDWHDNLGNIKRTIPMTVDAGGCSVYRWHYDWRLSPLTLADELNELIAAVKADTGATKVDIISRCLGSNIAYAYLNKYGTEFVNSCVLYEPSIDGIGVVNAIWTGNVVIDGAALNRFVNYFQKEKNFVIKDEKTTDMLLEVLDILQDAGAAVGTQLFNNVKDDVVPRILKEAYGTFPAYWSMASADKVQDALGFVFKDDADQYTDLIDQINAYYDIEKDAHNNLKAMADAGLNFSVIAKYGFPAFPLSEDATQESDVYVTAGFTSMGATCADVGSTLGKSHSGQYVSPDKKIDASTALFPDKTWLIKDLGHKEFPDCVNDLIVEFLQNPAMTVFSNPTYPQYLQFTATNSETSDDATGTLAPVTAPAEPSGDSSGSGSSGGSSLFSGSSVSPLDAFFKFLVKLFSFITRLFKK